MTFLNRYIDHGLDEARLGKAQEIRDPMKLAAYVFKKHIYPKITNPAEAFGGDVDQAKAFFLDLSQRFRFGNEELWSNSGSVEEMGAKVKAMEGITGEL